MIVGSTLRRGGRIASKLQPAIAGRIGGSSCRSSPAAPLGASLLRCVEPSTPTAQPPPQRQFGSLSIASSNLTSTSQWRRCQPPIQILLGRRTYGATPSLSQSTAPAFDEKETSSKSSKSKITPALREAIIADLKSVDFDGNGRIDADELQVLLGRYNETFSESEILELCEIFYTSTGAASVEIYRFMEALDAAAEDRSTSGGGETDGGEATPLAVKGAFKTHPLGIGTCASEYM